MDKTWTCFAEVTRVIDGDTFAADFDLGWGVWLRESLGRPNRVRLLNYDSPERGQPGWDEATVALKTILPVGASVWVESVKLDSFGRTLGKVYLPDGTYILDLLPQQWWLP